jgi:molecular chaperone DnaK (HSP70)
LWVFLCCLGLNGVNGQIMSVDLGHQFFKVALMRQGVPLEIVLNAHSARKTTTAVSFFLPLPAGQELLGRGYPEGRQVVD